MNPEIKAKWLEALRSGNYKQGVGMLKNGLGEFCCLGVLCELAIEDGVQVEVTQSGVKQISTGFPLFYKFDGSFELPPDSVKEWAGLAEHNPIVRVPFKDSPDYYGEGVPEDAELVEENLAELNDSGWSFERIADVIERCL